MVEVKSNSNLKRISLSIISTMSAAALTSARVFAYDCALFSSDLNSGEAPNPLAIVCVVSRVLNVAILVVGFVFIGTIAYGAYKLSMALGDPKGLSGAQQTWTYAFMGVLIVVGFFALMIIFANVFGIQGYVSPNFITARITNGIIGLLGAAGIQNY